MIIKSNVYFIVLGFIIYTDTIIIRCICRGRESGFQAVDAEVDERLFGCQKI